MKKINVVPFDGTQEQEEQLHCCIAEMKNQPDCLIPVMQKAQEIYDYLPMEVQKIIAGELEIPVEKVYGSATFYTGFRLNPKGKYQLTVCLGSACHLKQSDAVFEKVKELLGVDTGECTPDRMFSVEERHCVGACAVGPVLMVNDRIIGSMTPEKVPQILEQCRNEAAKENVKEEQM